MSLLSINSVKIVTIECDEYPDMLRFIASPPLVLYCRGKFIDLNKYICIASVGTRNPSSYGKKITYSILRDVCKEGFVIVSGMAQGIDAVSHKAAIESGCPTVAFIATGVDIIYPKLNSHLFKKILETGMIVSEYPLGTTPKPYYFPERNRLISGVSKGVFISEAASKSGSAITMSYALEQGKDIFALPGNVDAPLSQEPNRLLKLGAFPVTEANDIISHYKEIYFHNMDFLDLEKTKETKIDFKIEEKNDNKEQIKFPDGYSDEEKLTEALKSDALDIDSLSLITDISLDKLNVLLLSMELDGKIKTENGNYFLIK